MTLTKEIPEAARLTSVSNSQCEPQSLRATWKYVSAGRRRDVRDEAVAQEFELTSERDRLSCVQIRPMARCFVPVMAQRDALSRIGWLSVRGTWAAVSERFRGAEPVR